MAALNQERFTLATDNTTEELQNMMQKISTPAKVHSLFWLSVWKMWCEGKSIALEIEAHQLAEMNSLVLKKFYSLSENQNSYDLPALPPCKFYHVYIIDK